MLSLFQLMAEKDQVELRDKLHILCEEAAGGIQKLSAPRRHCLFSYEPV